MKRELFAIIFVLAVLFTTACSTSREVRVSERERNERVDDDGVVIGQGSRDIDDDDEVVVKKRRRANRDLDNDEGVIIKKDRDLDDDDEDVVIKKKKTVKDDDGDVVVKERRERRRD